MPDITTASGVFLLLSATISLGLLLFALNGYRRTRDPSMAFLAGAFTLFAAKNLLVAYSIFTGFIGHEGLELIDAVGDLGTVFLIMVPVFWPSKVA